MNIKKQFFANRQTRSKEIFVLQTDERPHRDQSLRDLHLLDDGRSPFHVLGGLGDDRVHLLYIYHSVHDWLWRFRSRQLL